MVFNLMSHNIVANNVRDIVLEFWKLYHMVKPPFKIHIFSKKRVYTKYEFYEQALKIYTLANGCMGNHSRKVPQYGLLDNIKKHSNNIRNRFVVNPNSQELPSEQDNKFAIHQINAMWHVFNLWSKFTKTRIL